MREFANKFDQKEGISQKTSRVKKCAHKNKKMVLAAAPSAPLCSEELIPPLRDLSNLVMPYSEGDMEMSNPNQFWVKGLL